eukprot:2662774-Rhodomonas_salina.1
MHTETQRHRDARRETQGHTDTGRHRDRDIETCPERERDRHAHTGASTQPERGRGEVAPGIVDGAALHRREQLHCRPPHHHVPAWLCHGRRRLPR